MLEHLISILFIFITSMNFSQSNFCDGVQNGFLNISKKYDVFLGFTPICSNNNNNKNYQSGYKLGVQEAEDKSQLLIETYTFKPIYDPDPYIYQNPLYVSPQQKLSNETHDISITKEAHNFGFKRGYRDAYKDNNKIIGFIPSSSINFGGFKTGYDLGYQAAIEEINKQ